MSFGALGRSKPPETSSTDECVVLLTNPVAQNTSERSKDREDPRRRLFDEKPGSSTKGSTTVEGSASKCNTLPKKETAPTADNPADGTVDLKSPRSRSGQHWKREYQRDHDKSKLEMRKLIRYGQAAKSYAIKRDQEAIRLGDKLKDTEGQVQEMESKVSELAAQLSDARLHDDNQARILDDLASQTAQALRYKQKAERYRLALRDSQPGPSANPFQDDTLPTTAQEFQDKITAEAEVLNLKKGAEQTQRQVAELEKKNTALKQTISKAKEEMKLHEERTQKSYERRKRREERLVAEKKDLKDQLSKRDEQIKDLREKLERGYLPTQQSSKYAAQGQKRNDRSHRVTSRPVESYVRDTVAELSSAKTSDMKENETIREHKPYRKDLHTTIQRNGYDIRAREPALKQKEAPMLNSNFSDQSIEVPRSKVPPKESSDIWMQMEEDSSDQQTFPPAQLDRALTSVSLNTTRYRPNAESPPLTPAIQDRSRRDTLLSSSLLGPKTERKALPADRVAAAKKRLQQRRAEKMRSLGGKENIKITT